MSDKTIDKTIDDDTLRVLLAAAPAGPWTVEQMGDDSWALIRPAACECGRPGCHLGIERVDRYEGCARLTVHAPALALAAEVLRLMAERDAMRRRAEEVTIEARDIGWERDHLRAAVDSIAAAARAYRDATDVPDGEYDAARHAEALAALTRVLGGGR